MSDRFRVRPPSVFSGQVFGRLTVDGEQGRANGGRTYHCVCECGRTKVVRSSHLRSGLIVSCGCRLREQQGLIAVTYGGNPGPRLLPGERRKWLTIVRAAGRPKRYRYLCQCDCGQLVEISGSNFGYQRSCGCARVKYSHSDVLEALRAFHVEFSRWPSYDEWVDSRLLPSVRVAQDRFGSWANAKSEARRTRVE